MAMDFIGERRRPERRDPFMNQPTRVLLVAVPLAGIFAAVSLVTDVRDGLRVFVLAQATVIVVLYAQALWNVVDRVRRPSHDKAANEIRRGHMCLLLAIFVLLSEEILRVIARIGEGILNWRTPLLQVALLLLFFAWLWLERRSWRTDEVMLKPTPRQEGLDRARERAEQRR